jgi:RND family efflux transporter MFP subunit
MSPKNHRRPAARGIDAVLMLLALLALATACHRSAAPAAARPTIVRVKTLAPERASSSVRYSATIQEREAVDLSFQVSGTVASLLRVAASQGERDVQEGDAVAQGAVLAELDRRDYQRDVDLASARRERARSDIPRAQANAERWSRELARLKELENTGAVTGKQIDETRSQSEVADAELETAKRVLATSEIELRQAQDRLSDCVLKNPLEGASVAAKSVKPGERIVPNAVVFRVMDVRTVHVLFGVPDLMLHGSTGDLHVELDQRLPVTVQAFEGERFEGVVTKIAPSADPETRTFLVEVTLDNQAGRLKPGMIATIRVGAERESLLLPLTAVQRGGAPGETAVYVVAGEDGRTVARRRRVALGGVYDNQVEVLEAGSDVHRGDAVVVTNAWRLDEGREVAVVSAAVPEEGK